MFKVTAAGERGTEAVLLAAELDQRRYLLRNIKVNIVGITTHT